MPTRSTCATPGPTLWAGFPRRAKGGRRPGGSRRGGGARAGGIKVEPPAEAARLADVVMLLVPDHIQKRVFEQDLKPGLTSGKTLMFAHGFNVHFGAVEAPEGVDVSMIAPKSPGHRLRELYQE